MVIDERGRVIRRLFRRDRRADEVVRLLAELQSVARRPAPPRASVATLRLDRR